MVKYYAKSGPVCGFEQAHTLQLRAVIDIMPWVISILVVSLFGFLIYYFVKWEPGRGRTDEPTSTVKRAGFIETALADYVVIDIETTGLSPAKDHIVQVAAVRYINHTEAEHFATYVNPPCHIPSRTTAIHGITDSTVQNAPTIHAIEQQLITFIGGRIVAGYNVKFDLGFLSAAYGPSFDEDMEILDVLKYVRQAIPGMPNYKLETVSSAVGYRGRSHDALSDCRATAAVLKFLCQLPDDYQPSPEDAPETELDITQVRAPEIPMTPFYGKTVLLLGTLKSYDRFHVAAILLSLFARLGKNFVQTTDCVIVGTNPGEKYERVKQAIQQGRTIRVINEEEYSSIMDTLPEGLIQGIIEKWG